MDSFSKLLEEKILIFDGAMGSSLQAQELSIDDWGGPEFENCSENLLYTKPEAVEKVHEGFLNVGVDVIETNSFGGSGVVLAEFGLEDKTYEINKMAAEMAKRIAADFSTASHPRFVAGSIGPGTKLPTLGHITFRDLKKAYDQQVSGLVEGGSDLLIVETCQDLLQTKAALMAVFDYFEAKRIKLPVIAQVTIETFGTMLNGTEIGAALTALEPFPIDVIGMNCGTGPRQMTESLKYLCEHSRFPVSVLPNAGLPEVKDGKQHYDETPETFTGQIVHFAKDFGVNIVGGCCGTTSDHLKLVVEEVSRIEPHRRKGSLAPSASSIYFRQPYTQDASFLIVGERVNASGSRKMRRLLEAEDWDGLVSLAKEQEREGAHILDVNVDFVGRDGEADMHELVSRLVTNVKIPLMLDSTEWEKMEAGLEHAGGKCLLNSTNYEDGEPRFFKVLELAKRFGAGVVVGTIDEDGMARTASKKVEIARRAIKDAVAFGIPEHDIFFDPLALPISTGIEEDRNNADETIKAIKQIHSEFPEANIILGVSNISFGLSPAARIVLNSIFLHDAVEAGMNSAIVNASKILPLNRFNEREIEVARELIYDRREFEGDVCTYDPLTEFTTLFEGKKASAIKKDVSNLSIEEKLKHHIIDGEKIGLEDNLTKALEKYEPLDIINEILLDGMKVVGDLFGSGQMQLPFVLQSAEAMKTAVKFLEPHMEKVEGQEKGTMVLATVKGDVHDIGKNLVDIILTNNGYKVVNLGIKQPIDEILKAAEEQKADAIGMSGLLVKSTLIMRDNLEIMNERAISTPVVLGGAALNRKYVDNDLLPLFDGKLFYARDAFDGLNAMDELARLRKSATEDAEPTEKVKEVAVGRSSGEQRSGGVPPAMSAEREKEDDEDLVGEDAKLGRKAARFDRNLTGDTSHTTRSETEPAEFIPELPFYGSKVVEIKDLTKVFAFVNETALFKGQWQFKQGRKSPEEYQKILEETVYPKYEQIKADAIRDKLLEAKLVYGYYPCNSEGNDLIIFEEDGKTEQMRFNFPRQPVDQLGSKNLCLADYFLPVSSGSNDTVAFHLVTMGRKASEHSAELFKNDDYTDYLLFHGLSVESAEALAEMWHKRIREELGIAGEDAEEMTKLFRQGYQGSRFSFGYPACPSLEDQVKLFELLRPDRIGVELTDEYQLDPEQSTSAIIVHHPAARYFNVG
ncbi:MAG: methionine synthase [Acidobacteria bacterium]|nr:MAG: methionine synthase [Acidobacteriota bacterium]REK01739.1 MAG: methionine synthase [Acidobacteriota bacterium]REK14695.1 MAG: methionine synthase [Acidobacteriota bacterium]REK45410.1 MAG: methionine synthase [Acidobacteriota bacterium]